MATRDPRLEDAPESVNEAVRDRALRHAFFLERLKTSEVRKVLKFYEADVLPDLILQLEKRLNKKALSKSGQDAGPITTLRLQQLIVAVREILSESNRIVKKELRSSLIDIGKAEAVWQAGALKAEIPFELEFVVPSVSQVRHTISDRPFDGQIFNKWFNNMTLGLENNIARELRQGIFQGQTNRQIVKRLRPILGAQTKGKIDALVRSSVTHVANQSREVLYAQNADIVKSVMWVSTLDSRTCQQCQNLDGKTFNINRGPRPPVHINCRCSTVPVLVDARGLPIDTSDGTVFQRASMNGQVPRDLTFNEWLKREASKGTKESREIVEEALGGKDKAQLFIKGGMSKTDFTRDGKVLTLAQLKATDPGAFLKAGLT